MNPLHPIACTLGGHGVYHDFSALPRITTKAAKHTKQSQDEKQDVINS